MTSATVSAKQISSSVVLVIDDRADQRALFEAIAKRLGFGAHIVSCWDEAIAPLETVAFDAVLMDIQMPDVDGLEATRRLREIDQRNGTYTPVIAVTARAMDGDRESCLSAGMDDYLSKPFTVEQLKSLIELWCSRR